LVCRTYTAVANRECRSIQRMNSSIHYSVLQPDNVTIFDDKRLDAFVAGAECCETVTEVSE